MKFIRTVIFSAVAATVLVFSLSATAQYQWLDASGRKVFSDQPPPANIPAKRILQQPGKAAAAAPLASTAAEEKPAGGADIAAKPATKAAAPEKIVNKDKDLEAAKKKADDEAAAKKKAEDDARNVARADNCVRAKQAKTTLDSGVRLNQYNAKGERVFMDEAARMVESKRLEGIMATDCN
jgi:Domain of unknown function (DUF4124)